MLRCIAVRGGSAALLLSCVALFASPTAPLSHAETDASVAIACEALFDAIDGDPTDVATIFDKAKACTSNTLGAAEVANLADALGDQDDTLEPSDFSAIDRDANQILNGGGEHHGAILLFQFVDNDGIAYFDAEFGVDTVVFDDGGGLSEDSDANPETCTALDDLDCGTAVLSDGDGIVVGRVQDNQAGDPGDSVDVEMFQEDDTAQESIQTIQIVGQVDEIMLEVLKNPILATSNAAEFDDCRESSDWSTSAQLSDPNRTFLKATVVDAQARELTRMIVEYQVDAPNIADFDSTAGEAASEPQALTPTTLDLGGIGIGSLLVVCGGTTTGLATLTATEALTNVDADAIVQVTAAPADIQLNATPAASIDCDGVDAATIIATVTDSNGNAVADGTLVNFAVTSVGTVDPVNAVTANGVALTTFRGFSATSVGVPVLATAGNAQDSILMQCIAAGADTDGDGMPNAYESAHACLSATTPDGSLDPDNDDLSSHTEFLQSLDPCDADTDDDTRSDAADNCPLVPNTAQTNTDVSVNPPGDVAGDACDTNDDNDGCTDLKETAGNPALGGDRDPLAPWDFFDVPAPAGPAVGQNGGLILTQASVRNRVITLQDVGVVLAYVGRSSASPDYAQDANSDGYADGVQMDRTPSTNVTKPWRSGAPNGAVSLQDVGVVLAQVGHRCTP
jgi:hypothetical protein